MTQKILAAHAGLDTVSAGQLIEADLDLVLGNDITSPVAIHEIKKMKVEGVFNKDKIALIVVDLPLPFGPNNPKISPAFTSKDKLSTATKFLYDLVKFLTSIRFIYHYLPSYLIYIKP